MEINTGNSDLCLLFSYFTKLKLILSVSFNCLYKIDNFKSYLHCVEKGQKVHTKCYMITNSTPKFKKHFFLDLAKSGRSGQYLAGTGPDLKKLTGSTGTGFPVAPGRTLGMLTCISLENIELNQSSFL